MIDVGLKIKTHYVILLEPHSENKILCSYTCTILTADLLGKELNQDLQYILLHK